MVRMQIQADEPSQITRASSLKSLGFTAFTQGNFQSAIESFESAAEIALSSLTSSSSDLTNNEKIKTLSNIYCTSFSNSSMCALSLKDYDKARYSSTKCIDFYTNDSNGKNVPVGVVFKARYRLAMASVCLVEEKMKTKNNDDDSQYQEEWWNMLNEAQNQLKIVLKDEPGNEQCLALAQKGLNVSNLIRQSSTPTAIDTNIVTSPPPTKYEKYNDKSGAGIIASALNGCRSNTGRFGGDAGWGMSSSFQDYQDSLIKKEDASIPSIPSIPSSLDSKDKNENEQTVQQILTHLKATSIATEANQIHIPNKSHAAQEAFTELTTTTETLQIAQYNQTLQNQTDHSTKFASYDISSSAVAVAVANLKTTESNYSNDWRSNHVIRRYTGKDPKFLTSTSKDGGGDKAWSELEERENQAVEAVGRTVEVKKMLVKSRDDGTAAATANGSDNDEETKEWRKQLKLRRTGSEIKVEKSKTKKTDSIFNDLLGVEDEEVERVNVLKKERVKAEKKAERKRRGKMEVL